MFDIKKAFDQDELDKIDQWVHITVGPYIKLMDEATFQATKKTTFFQMLIGKFSHQKYMDNIKKKCGSNVKFYATQTKCWSDMSPHMRAFAKKIKENDFKI